MPRGNAYNAAYLEYQDQLMRDLIKMAETEQTSRAERLTKAQAQIDALNGQIAELAGAVDNPDMQRQLAQDQFNADMNIATFKEGQRGEVSVTTGGQTTTRQGEEEDTGALIPEPKIQTVDSSDELQSFWAALQDETDPEAVRRKTGALLDRAKDTLDYKLTSGPRYSRKQALTNVAQMVAHGMTKGLSGAALTAYTQEVSKESDQFQALNQAEQQFVLRTAQSLARREGVPQPAPGQLPDDVSSVTASDYTKVTRKLGPDTPAPEYAAPDITTPEMEAELAALRGQRAGLEDEIERLMAGRHPDVMARAQSMFQQYAPIYQEKSRRARQLAGEFADAQMMRKTGLRPEQLLEGTALEGIDPSLFSKLDMSELPQSTRRLAQQVQTAQQRINALNDLESQRGTGRVAIDRYVGARARGAAEQRARTAEEPTEIVFDLDQMTFEPVEPERPAGEAFRGNLYGTTPVDEDGERTNGR